MNDKQKKSALPDLGEVTSMATKLFKDVKNSVTEIVGDYQEKRKGSGAQASSEAPTQQTPPQQPQAPEAKPSAPKQPQAENKPKDDS